MEHGKAINRATVVGMQKMTFEEWLVYGVENKFCSPQVCDTHDGAPMTETEEKIWDEGHDPCVLIVRLGNEEEWEATAKDYLEI